MAPSSRMRRPFASARWLKRSLYEELAVCKLPLVSFKTTSSELDEYTETASALTLVLAEIDALYIRQVVHAIGVGLAKCNGVHTSGDLRIPRHRELDATLRCQDLQVMPIHLTRNPPRG